MPSMPGRSVPGRGRWWSRTRGLPDEVHRSYRVAVDRSTSDGEGRILAWAPTPDGFCIGSTAAVWYGGTDSWAHVGWHEIERGGWNVDTSRLRWTTYAGERGLVELTEPGRLPELFRERVAASIVLEKMVPVAGSRGLTITGRRDLGRPESPIIWHTRLGQGLNWETPGLKGLAEEALARVRSEYDIGR